MVVTAVLFASSHTQSPPPTGKRAVWRSKQGQLGCLLFSHVLYCFTFHSRSSLYEARLEAPAGPAPEASGHSASPQFRISHTIVGSSACSTNVSMALQWGVARHAALHTSIAVVSLPSTTVT